MTTLKEEEEEDEEEEAYYRIIHDEIFYQPNNIHKKKMENDDANDDDYGGGKENNMVRDDEFDRVMGMHSITGTVSTLNNNVVDDVGFGNADDDGVWVGIDLGTSNTTCAVYDIQQHCARLLPLDVDTNNEYTLTNDYDEEIDNGDGASAVMPSTVLLFDRGKSGRKNEMSSSSIDGVEVKVEKIIVNGGRTINCLVGRKACRVLERSFEKHSEAKKKNHYGDGRVVVDGGGESFMALTASMEDKKEEKEGKEQNEANTCDHTSNVVRTFPRRTTDPNAGTTDDAGCGDSGRCYDEEGSFISHVLNWANPVKERTHNSLSFSAVSEEEEEESINVVMENLSSHFTPGQVSDAMISGTKRVLGLHESDISSSSPAAHKINEGSDGVTVNKDFLSGLPFDPVIISEDDYDETGIIADNKKGNNIIVSSGSVVTETITKEDEGTNGIIAARISPLHVRGASHMTQTRTMATSPCTVDISPMHIASIILGKVRIAAENILSSTHQCRRPIHAPGMLLPMSSTAARIKVKNCVVGVPCFYSRKQRLEIVKACRLAGFDGIVRTINESTAAAMSYGLFVSPNAGITAEEECVSDSAVQDAADDDKVINSSNIRNRRRRLRRRRRMRRRRKGKEILVFDMGGGTTDVTIATLSTTTTTTTKGDVGDDNGGDSGIKEDDDENARFQVRSTSGDLHLGGNDFDDLLANWFLERIQQQQHAFTTNIDADNDDECKNANVSALSPRLSHCGYRRGLQDACRIAKEELCGNNNNDQVDRVFVKFQNECVELTLDKFEELVEPLVQRALIVVEDAVQAAKAVYVKEMNKKKRDEEVNEQDMEDEDGEEEEWGIDEVVLVGGGSRVPCVRKMLSNRFPPPNVPSLCYSLNPQVAVAQGCAIQSAILSQKVPKHELRSAMMLDALPHSIGVLLDEKDGNSNKNKRFVPVLWKNMILPARNYLTFDLEDLDQCGVTIQAEEDVGGHNNNRYQHLGTFTFLLHKLTEQEKMKILAQHEHDDDHDDDGNNSHNDNHSDHRNKDDGRKRKKDLPRRTIDVGMSLEENGKFIVSIFDWNDPEHLNKRKRYLANNKKKNSSSKKNKKSLRQHELNDEVIPKIESENASAATVEECEKHSKDENDDVFADERVITNSLHTNRDNFGKKYNGEIDDDSDGGGVAGPTSALLSSSQPSLSSSTATATTPTPMEQIYLAILCVLLFLLYITAKIMFHQQHDHSDTMITWVDDEGSIGSDKTNDFGDL